MSPTRLNRAGRVIQAVLGISPLLVLAGLAAWLASEPGGGALVDPARESILGIPGPLLQLVLSTVPLAASVAAIVFLWRGGWLGEGSISVAAVAAIIAGTFYIAKTFGLSSAVEPARELPHVGGVVGLVAAAGNYLAGSFFSYGPWRFAAAVIGGGVIGAMWHDRLRAIAAALRDDGDAATRETDTPLRQAA